jgi:hypothetical protein
MTRISKEDFLKKSRHGRQEIYLSDYYVDDNDVVYSVVKIEDDFVFIASENDVFVVCD